MYPSTPMPVQTLQSTRAVDRLAAVYSRDVITAAKARKVVLGSKVLATTRVGSRSSGKGKSAVRQEDGHEMCVLYLRSNSGIPNAQGVAKRARQAAWSGSQAKTPTFAGGYLLSLWYRFMRKVNIVSNLRSKTSVKNQNSDDQATSAAGGTVLIRLFDRK